MREAVRASQICLTAAAGTRLGGSGWVHVVIPFHGKNGRSNCNEFLCAFVGIGKLSFLHCVPKFPKMQAM